MTPSQLKKRFLEAYPKAQYFSPYNMAKYGDTMHNFGVSATTMTVVDLFGRTRTCWKLYRRKPSRKGLRGYALFDCDTFARVLTAATEIDGDRRRI